jgi:hypothetical protein
MSDGVIGAWRSRSDKDTDLEYLRRRRGFLKRSAIPQFQKALSGRNSQKIEDCGTLSAYLSVARHRLCFGSLLQYCLVDRNEVPNISGCWGRFQKELKSISDVDLDGGSAILFSQGVHSAHTRAIPGREIGDEEEENTGKEVPGHNSMASD